MFRVFEEGRPSEREFSTCRSCLVGLGRGRIRSAHFANRDPEDLREPFDLALYRSHGRARRATHILRAQKCRGPRPQTGWRKFSVAFRNCKSVAAYYVISVLASLLSHRGRFVLLFGWNGWLSMIDWGPSWELLAPGRSPFRAECLLVRCGPLPPPGTTTSICRSKNFPGSGSLAGLETARSGAVLR